MKSKSKAVVYLLCVWTLILISTRGLSAQTGTASITGRVFDPNNAVMFDAKVTAKNVDTGIERSVSTNDVGIYHFANLDPGSYEISVSRSGFSVVRKPGITLHVADTVSLNFSLKVGSINETVTVEAGAPVINTMDGSVSTVVDRRVVENMPLNGRSLQDLILLTPGVVTNSPQSPGGIGGDGEFSVNGQRTTSNYYTVDGVSANTNVVAGALEYPSAGGAVSASTALGTTQALASIDALQEFRVESSTYSAEYGRNPGGQFGFITRSGNNRWRATAFDYLRNNFFDANDWFNDNLHIAEPPLRQNDFGGTFGGPVRVPSLYNGIDKTFFFFSYEGLRLIQPQPATVMYVPDTALRQATAASMQPLVNAFPKQNGAEVLTPCDPLTDPGCSASGQKPSGAAQFTGSWSNPSHVDSYSIRLDHNVSTGLKLFFRFASTPSAVVLRDNSGDAADSVLQSLDTLSTTGGATETFSSKLSNDLRVNYTRVNSRIKGETDGFGGATPVDFLKLSHIANPGGEFDATLILGNQFPYIFVPDSFGRQEQWNIVNSTTLVKGNHVVKVGVDWRLMMPSAAGSSPSLSFQFMPADLVAGNVSSGFASANARQSGKYYNVSFFSQDDWRVSSRLSVAFGLRWELNPPPGVSHGILPYTTRGNIPGSVVLAPEGTRLWNTEWYDFAPRLSAAYIVRQRSGFDTVVRGGGGIFFDTGGQQVAGLGFLGPGFSGTACFGSSCPGSPSFVSFPVSASSVTPPIAAPTQPLPSFTTVYSFPSSLQTPYTWQTNVSIQQGLGASQSITASYIGAFARKLIEQNQLRLTNSPSFCDSPCFLRVFQNGHTSDYDALQVQFQQRLVHGLTTLAAYTWSHVLDYGSSNAEIPYTRGDSDLDVRHNLSAALSYDVPWTSSNRLSRYLLDHWGLDTRWMSRTAFPVTINGAQVYDPSSGRFVSLGLNLVPGQPLYLSGSACMLAPPVGFGEACPGGKGINPNALTLPPDCTTALSCGSLLPGNVPRNFFRGFGAWQMDLAVRRDFPVYEGVHLQFRAEAFNIFNHPNFGHINTFYGCCSFGLASTTLSQSLGVLSPLYQMGGPRSMQLALRLSF